MSRNAQNLPAASLADILERVLDKGIVVAGDIKVKLVDIELLTIQVRLVVCSVDKAMEMGMDWWRKNPDFVSAAPAPAALPAPAPVPPAVRAPATAAALGVPAP